MIIDLPSHWADRVLLCGGAVVRIPMMLAYTTSCYWAVRGKVQPTVGHH